MKSYRGEVVKPGMMEMEMEMETEMELEMLTCHSHSQCCSPWSCSPLWILLPFCISNSTGTSDSCHWKGSPPDALSEFRHKRAAQLLFVGIQMLVWFPADYTEEGWFSKHQTYSGSSHEPAYGSWDCRAGTRWAYSLQVMWLSVMWIAALNIQLQDH